MNADGNVAVSDALSLLRFAVGQSVGLNCPAGLHCWDNDDDGVCSADEDVNHDDGCDTLDCQGASASEEGLLALSSNLRRFDIAGATRLADTNDDYAVKTLEFDVELAGGTYTRAAVSMNGYIYFFSCRGLSCPFLPPDEDFNNTPLPTDRFGNGALLAAYWDDLEPKVAGVNGVFYSVTGNEPNRVMRFTWSEVRVRNSSTSTIDFVVSIHETSSLVDVSYKSVSEVTGSGATIGFQAGGTGSGDDRVLGTAYPIGGAAAVLDNDITGALGQSWSIAPVR